MGEPITPACAKDATNCVLCDMIRNIFEGFPTETDPGCEIGEANAGQAGGE